jgi:membrane protein DedA with SNARE-associated domain
VGSRLGRGRPEQRVESGGLDRRHLDRACAFFTLWGWWAVVVGALCWAGGLTVLGHLAASEPVLRHASYVVAGLFVALPTVAGVVGRVRRRRLGRQ